MAATSSEQTNEETFSSENVLIELFNSFSTNQEALGDTLSKLRVVATGDRKKFEFISSKINIDLLLTVISEYSATATTTTITTRPSAYRTSSAESEVVSDACCLLAKILASMKTHDVFERYGKYIIASYSLAQCEEFQTLCLQQILRLAEEDKSLVEFMSNPDLILLTIKYLGDDRLGLASISRKILNLLFRHNEHLQWFFSNDIIQLCKDISLKNSIIQFRIYEIFVDFVLMYPEHVETCQNVGIFDGLIASVTNSNDILSQLNALELLSKIAKSGPQGLKYVEDKSIMTWVEKTISSQETFVGLLLPGAIKFFGVVAHANPLEIIPKYQSTTNSLFENMVSEDPTMRCLCAETIAFISTKPEGLKSFNSNPGLLKKSVQVMAKIITNPGEEDHVRRRTSESLCSMFNQNNDDVEVSMICEKLFRQIDHDPVSYLFKLAQTPFTELRYSSLKLLVSVSQYGWTEQDFALSAGFIEFLLDRKTETEKQGRELKYEIVKNLSLSPTAKDNLGVDYHDKIVRYAKEGPFHSEAQVSVMYQREN